MSNWHTGNFYKGNNMIYINEVITSRSNPTVKLTSSLKDKKSREAEGLFIAEGEKLTFEALSASLPIEKIFIAKSKKDRIIDKLSNYNDVEKLSECSVYVLEDSVFEKISTENAPQGVISVIKHLDFFYQSDIIYKEEFFKNLLGRAICLSSVRDPGNLGSAIRSAVAFGVEHIIMSSDCADIYNPKTVRGAMGSLFRVKTTRIDDMCEFISLARKSGRRVYTAELNSSAAALGSFPLLSTDIVIIGNEGHGVSEDVSKAADGALYIPISSKTESLNASVAAAIFMWEQGKIN